MGVPLAFVLEVGCFGRGRRLAVIEGRSMRYGRSSWKCVLVARREMVWVLQLGRNGGRRVGEG